MFLINSADRFLKKIKYSLNKLSFNILLGFLSLFIFFSCSICSNTISCEKILPDEKYKIVLFERTAGATTRKSLQISIVKNKKDLSNSSGNICITDGDILKFEVLDDMIIISYSGTLYKSERKYKNYIITYQRVTSDL